MNFEWQWREVAERVRPQDNVFQNQLRTPGEKVGQRQFDATASLALERFAAALESMIAPRVQRWHSLKIPALRGNLKVQRYLEDVTDILFQERYSPRANFASQIYESFMSLGAYGSQILFTDEDIGYGMRYRSCHIGEVFFAENHQGMVDIVHRKFPMTARQIVQKFGAFRVPDKIKSEAFEVKEKTYEVVHHVGPQGEFKYGRSDYRGMPYTSCYILCEQKVLLQEGGYRSMPYAVSRYVTAPREKYGRGPAMTVLPDIKTLNEMSKTMLRSGQKAVDPPILLPEDGLLRAFDLRAGALNYGGLSDRGDVLARPLDLGGRVELGLELQEQKRKVINDSFLITLFQILVETPEMTATEALIRAQEKGALLAPTMGRQNSELLGPTISREIDILSRAGIIPPIPPEILELGVDGVVDIEYTSPLSRLQKSEDAVGILRTLDAVTPIAQIDGSVLDTFDWDETVRILSEVNGVPARALLGKEEVAQKRASRQEQANAQQLLEAGPMIGQTVKDMTAAVQATQNSPQIQPLPAPV